MPEVIPRHHYPRFGLRTLAVYETEDGLSAPVGPVEDKVLQRFLATADSNAQMAAHFGYSEKHVKNTMSRLLAKFRVENRTQLYRVASRARRISRPS